MSASLRIWGRTKPEAVIEAGKTRFRPVIPHRAQTRSSGSCRSPRDGSFDFTRSSSPRDLVSSQWLVSDGGGHHLWHLPSPPCSRSSWSRCMYMILGPSDERFRKNHQWANSDVSGRSRHRSGPGVKSGLALSRRVCYIFASDMVGFPSGQREQTVNLSAQLSMVRIHPPPPKLKRAREFNRGLFFSKVYFSYISAKPVR